MQTYVSGELPGKLIAVEGLDGSGKSTQLYLLKRWLELRGLKVFFTEWNSSVIVKKATSKGKKRHLLTPTTFSIIHCTDFADRYERQILPLLKAGYLVLCDRYIYTLMARDVVRGADRSWVKQMYGIALVPDLVIYLRVSPGQLGGAELSEELDPRLLGSGDGPGLSRDIFDSFIRYQRLIQKEFALMQQEYGIHTVNGNRSIRSVSTGMVSIVEGLLWI